MIFGYVGGFGSGKTLNMVFDIMRNMIYHKRHIFSNIPIQFWHKKKFYRADYIGDGKEFRRQVFKQRNTDIVVDEAGIYFPNFMWNKIPEQILMQFHEQRKTGCNFYYTTQVNKHAVKRLRDLSFIISMCTKFRILPIPYIEFFLFGKRFVIDVPKIYVARRFWPAFFEGNMDSAKKWERYYLGTRWLYPSDSRRVFQAYKTNFIVDTSAMMHTDYDPDAKEEKKTPVSGIVGKHGENLVTEKKLIENYIKTRDPEYVPISDHDTDALIPI
jgi:hypothetical protein